MPTHNEVGVCFQRYVFTEQTGLYVQCSIKVSLHFPGVYITLCCWMLLAGAADHFIKAAPHQNLFLRLNYSSWQSVLATHYTETQWNAEKQANVTSERRGWRQGTIYTLHWIISYFRLPSISQSPFSVVVWCGTDHFFCMGNRTYIWLYSNKTNTHYNNFVSLQNYVIKQLLSKSYSSYRLI